MESNAGGGGGEVATIDSNDNIVTGTYLQTRIPRLSHPVVRGRRFAFALYGVSGVDVIASSRYEQISATGFHSIPSSVRFAARAYERAARLTLYISYVSPRGGLAAIFPRRRLAPATTVIKFLLRPAQYATRHYRKETNSKGMRE